MQRTESIYMPVGQTIKNKDNTKNIRKWIRSHEVAIVISSIAVTLLAIYGFLMIHFIQLLKMIR